MHLYLKKECPIGTEQMLRTSTVSHIKKPKNNTILNNEVMGFEKFE
jgi:hypothetical protein